MRAHHSPSPRLSAGRAAFAALKSDNTAFAPVLVQELKGIAEGAQVAMDEIWGEPSQHWHRTITVSSLYHTS